MYYFKTYQHSLVVSMSACNILLLPNYRHVVDYHVQTNINNKKKRYWIMSSVTKAVENLLKSLACEVHNHIHEWFGCGCR